MAAPARAGDTCAAILAWMHRALTNTRRAIQSHGRLRASQ